MCINVLKMSIFLILLIVQSIKQILVSDSDGLKGECLNIVDISSSEPFKSNILLSHH